MKRYETKKNRTERRRRSNRWRAKYKRPDRLEVAEKGYIKLMGKA